MISLSADFVTVRDASNHLAQVLDRAAQAPQVITRSGKPAAVVVDPATWDAAQQALAREAEYLQLLAEAAAARVARGESVDGEQVLASLDTWLSEHGGPIDWETADLCAYLDACDNSDPAKAPL